MSIAFVGDSYIRRLGEYMRAQRCEDLHMEGEVVIPFGLGGASIRGRTRIQPLLDAAIALPNVRVIYLHIGSNDLIDRRRAPEEVARDIVRLASYALASSETVRVIIGQIHDRLTAPDRDYPARVWRTNSALMAFVADVDRCSYAFIKGLCRPSPAVYCDGIHFNNRGNYKLMRGIRGAVLRATHSS